MLKATNRSKSFVVPSPTHENLHLEKDVHALDTIMAGEETASLQGSPISNTSSLRVKIPPRVTFNDAMRQSSLPSAESDVSFSESGMEWPSVSSVTETPHMLTIDGDEVELRRKNIQINPHQQPQKPQEPNIDFELDIKVLVKSGKCVLHTKEVNDGSDKVSTNSNSGSTTVRTHKRERSIGTDFGSPNMSRRSKEKTRMKYNPPVLVDLTIFHIPGLDVKLHYQSKTLIDEASPRISNMDPFGMPSR